MQKIKDNAGITILVLISYVIMIVMNILAEALPINGISTGEISDHYANLFAPAGITFAIWGLIYLLLLGYTIYQLIYFSGESDIKKQLFNKLGILFSISCAANALWMLAWHYEIIWLSFLLILAILICLIKINLIMRDSTFSVMENITVKLPFTVYLGWITIATIANATTFLVSVKWDRWSFSEVFWTNIIIIVGAVIGFTGVLFYKSFAYGCVLIWAYLGIALKHLSPKAFAGKYPSIIVTVFIAVAIIILSQIILVYTRVKRKKELSSD